jgi:hypothetical protein
MDGWTIERISALEMRTSLCIVACEADLALDLPMFIDQ